MSVYKTITKRLDLYLFSIIYFFQIPCFPFLKICSFQKISAGDIYVKKKEKKKGERRRRRREEDGRKKRRRRTRRKS